MNKEVYKYKRFVIYSSREDRIAWGCSEDRTANSSAEEEQSLAEGSLFKSYYTEM